MHHEVIDWQASPILAPLPRDTVVRLASAMPLPGAGGSEAAVRATLQGDAPWHVGDLFVLLSTGGVAPELVRVVGDVAVDPAGRWTATGRLE
jgi:hypothetical protein